MSPHESSEQWLHEGRDDFALQLERNRKEEKDQDEIYIEVDGG